jgi:hypothetical protein
MPGVFILFSTNIIIWIFGDFLFVRRGPWLHGASRRLLSAKNDFKLLTLGLMSFSPIM